jgi:poly(beta-D-mannuronate) lyase
MALATGTGVTTRLADTPPAKAGRTAAGRRRRDPFAFRSTSMTTRTGALGVLAVTVWAFQACSSSQSAGPGPAPVSQTGGRAGGTGGAPSPGSGGGGGVASGSGSGGTATGGTPGTGGGPAGSGGTGQGGQTSPDAADDSAPVTPPPSSDDQPLPACMKMSPVSSSAELATALTGATPGTCIVLADGSYTFPSVTNVATEAAPIVIRAMNRGKAVVASGNILLIKAAYVVIEGLDITSAGGASTIDFGGSNGVIVGFSDAHHCRLSRTRIHPMGAPAERDWIVVTGESHDNRIDHNDLGPQNALANMIVINGTGKEEPLTPGQVSQHNRIDHNYLHDITNTGGNNWEAMRIGRSWQAPTKGFTIVEHNLLKGATGDPETISLKSSDNTVRYNTMRATSGEICSRHGNRNQIYGNYILADGNGGSRGMRIYGADHRIYNNYVAAGASGIWLDDGSASATDEPGKEHYQVHRAWVFNNTIIGQELRIGGSKAFPPEGCHIANNIVTGAINGGGTGTVSEGNVVGANPLTMKDGIFRLLPGGDSARAVGKAVNTAFYGLMTDIDGQTRSEPDVGADEQSDSPVVFKGPLTAADVGPDSP